MADAAIDRTPVIIAVGEFVDRPADPALAQEPVALMAEALHAAEADAGVPLLAAIDSLDLVGQVSWRYRDPVGLLCERLGIRPPGQPMPAWGARRQFACFTRRRCEFPMAKAKSPPWSGAKLSTPSARRARRRSSLPGRPCSTRRNRQAGLRNAPHEPLCEKSRCHGPGAHLSALRKCAPGREGSLTGTGHARVCGSVGALCSRRGRQSLRLDPHGPFCGRNRYALRNQPDGEPPLSQADGRQSQREPGGHRHRGQPGLGAGGRNCGRPARLHPWRCRRERTRRLFDARQIRPFDRATGRARTRR